MTDMITIHTDGACSGNPGPGGFAAIIEHPDGDSMTVTGGDPATTNNRMELAAVIEALRAINSVESLRNSPVTVRSDSTYVTKAFNDNWIAGWQRRNWRSAKGDPVANQDLWQDLLKEIQGHTSTWVWVRGHSGDPMNERCDRLAVKESNFARTQNGYWASAGNPRSEDPAEADTQPKAEPAPTPSSTSQAALERNETAVNALNHAVTLLDSQRNQAEAIAIDSILKAIRHLEAQKHILNGDDLPF